MKRRGFKHPLGRRPLAEPLNAESIAKFYQVLRYSEDWREAAEVIFNGHLRLGMSAVGIYVLREPNKSDLLVSEMLYSFWKSIIKMRSGSIDHHSVPNVTGYMIRSLHGDLQHFLASDGLMRVNPVTFKKVKGDTKKVLCFSEEFEKGRLDDEHDPDLESEVYFGACQDDRDRNIVKMRVAGFTDEEIGLKFDLTKARIHKLRHEIAGRLKVRLDV